MVLALALVDKENADKENADKGERRHGPHARRRRWGHELPSFPLHKAQEIMTRSDFIRQLDRLNLFTITSDARVRASSVPMHRAFREVCADPAFRPHLAATLQRIADIESLGRTREAGGQGPGPGRAVRPSPTAGSWPWPRNGPGLPSRCG